MSPPDLLDQSYCCCMALEKPLHEDYNAHRLCIKGMDGEANSTTTIRDCNENKFGDPDDAEGTVSMNVCNCVNYIIQLLAGLEKTTIYCHDPRHIIDLADYKHEILIASFDKASLEIIRIDQGFSKLLVYKSQFSLMNIFTAGPRLNAELIEESYIARTLSKKILMFIDAPVDVTELVTNHRHLASEFRTSSTI